MANKKQLLCSSANNYCGLRGRVDCRCNHYFRWLLNLWSNRQWRWERTNASLQRITSEGQPSIKAPSFTCFGLNNLFREGVVAWDSGVLWMTKLKQLQVKNFESNLSIFESYEINLNYKWSFWGMQHIQRFEKILGKILSQQRYLYQDSQDSSKKILFAAELPSSFQTQNA